MVLDRDRRYWPSGASPGTATSFAMRHSSLREYPRRRRHARCLSTSARSQARVFARRHDHADCAAMTHSVFAVTSAIDAGQGPAMWNARSQADDTLAQASKGASVIDPEAEPSLYAAREPIFPRRVKGTFRTLKWWLMGMTLGIYYITPWLRWDRGPNLPDQAVLIDMAEPALLLLHDRDLAARILLRRGPSDHGRAWACSCSPRPPGGSGAAMPARRRSGPICSFWSNAGSRATATPASACTARTGTPKRSASARSSGRSGS